MAFMLLIMTHGAALELPTSRRPDHVALRTLSSLLRGFFGVPGLIAPRTRL